MFDISELEKIGIIIAAIAGVVVVLIGIAIYVRTKKNKSSALNLNLRMCVTNLHLLLKSLLTFSLVQICLDAES